MIGLPFRNTSSPDSFSHCENIVQKFGCRVGGYERINSHTKSSRPRSLFRTIEFTITVFAVYINIINTR